ncbi:unnamed protein product [Caenorhabditis nigoni]
MRSFEEMDSCHSYSFTAISTTCVMVERSWHVLWSLLIRGLYSPLTPTSSTSPDDQLPQPEDPAAVMDKVIEEEIDV